VLCQFSAEGGKKTLADYIKVPGIYPAGRLDFDSEGLVLLTDDGELQHRITDPKFGHPRTYWVQVEGIIHQAALESLALGVLIADRKTLPCEAAAMAEPLLPERNPPVRFRKSIPTSWLRLTLREGRNRQVRHMTAAVGFPTLRLVRAAIGQLTLAGLLSGESRELTRAEVAALRVVNNRLSSRSYKSPAAAATRLNRD
jgi:23S rRNA pseudouridine2457 synthase